MELSASQRKELEDVARYSHPAHVRVKALALLSLADNRPVGVVSAVLRVTRQSLVNWRRRYLAEGIAGFQIKPGRGRPSPVDLETVRETVRRSPREFGIEQTRWTLSAVAQAVPDLSGYSMRGVQNVLARAGLRYKRGQAWVHSPDPQYAEKKRQSTRR